MDSGATTFYSPMDSNHGVDRNGVALLLPSSHPFGPLLDISSHYIPTINHGRYLPIDTTLDQQRLWIHEVNATAQLAARTSFFDSLPSDIMDGIQHIFIGDFNVPFDSVLDTCTSLSLIHHQLRHYNNGLYT